MGEKLNTQRPENPGFFDFRSMPEVELRQKLDALRQCEPEMVTPSNAAATMAALRANGITGGEKAYWLRVQKEVFGVIEQLVEPANYNEVLANVIQGLRKL